MLTLALQAATANCCCYGGPPADNAAAVFADLTVTGTCVGCGPQVYKLTNYELNFAVGAWSKTGTYWQTHKL
jgi:hypothetical protein